MRYLKLAGCLFALALLILHFREVSERNRIAADFSPYIVPMAAADLAQKITSASTERAKPAFVYLYASWCPHCRLQLPILNELLEAGRLRNMELYFISLDFHALSLANYLTKYYEKPPFTVYHLPQRKGQTAVPTLSPILEGFTGTIPYIGILRADGKTAASFEGLVDKARLEKALENTMLSSSAAPMPK